MKYLTPQEVLIIHDDVIKKFGGSFGVRDVGLLESAVARPQASFDGQDLYPGIFSKAAALLHSLLKNHPFIDGNKRTALTSAAIFLRINDFKLVNKHAKELQFALDVAEDKLSLEQIADWLKKNSKKV